MTKRDLVPRVARWWLIAQEFNFTVEYRPGLKMAHVDALSRNPVDKPSENPTIVDVMQVNVTDDDWILSAQLQDERCKYLLEVLTKNPSNADEKCIHKEFCLKGQWLYKRTEKGVRWYVPKRARRTILMYYHDRKGHLGTEKTIKAVCENYWFPRMRKYISRYISSCLECLYNKVPAGKQEGFLHPIEKIATPMDTIHIDHLGPFVKSTKGNSYLIVAVDAFTKYLFAKAVASTKTQPLIRFVDEMINTFGTPRRIICDRGSCYTSNIFRDYAKQLGIKVVQNATATPRANGQVERYNRTILASLSATADDERKWDRHIDSIRFGINSSVHSVTTKSPHELLFGFKPRGRDDAFLTSRVTHDNGDYDVNETRKEAERKILAKQETQKAYYDAKRKACQKYDVGRQVLLRRSALANDGKSKKLLPKYSGPYVVTKVLDHDRYVVEDLPGARRAQKKYKGVCSADKLKSYSAAHESSSNASSSSSTSDNDEN